MPVSSRLYHCCRCHVQVIICSGCDRGQRYCPGACRYLARAESSKRAAKKYLSTRTGRFNNAARQQRFRMQIKQKVTHQGSTPDTPDDLLPIDPDNDQRCHSVEKAPLEAGIYCHFCHRACDPFLRNRFLRPPIRHRRKK